MGRTIFFFFLLLLFEHNNKSWWFCILCVGPGYHSHFFFFCIICVFQIFFPLSPLLRHLLNIVVLDATVAVWWKRDNQNNRYLFQPVGDGFSIGFDSGTWAPWVSVRSSHRLCSCRRPHRVGATFLFPAKLHSAQSQSARIFWSRWHFMVRCVACARLCARPTACLILFSKGTPCFGVEWCAAADFDVQKRCRSRRRGYVRWRRVDCRTFFFFLFAVFVFSFSESCWRRCCQLLWANCTAHLRVDIWVFCPTL